MNTTEYIYSTDENARQDFAEYLTEEEYAMYPAQYLRVSLGKGLMTPEWLEYLIGRYVVDKR